MNLSPPPARTGDDKQDLEQLTRWVELLYEFLKYPHFSQIRLIKKATPSESAEGVIFIDSDDDTLKVYNGTAWKLLHSYSVWNDLL